MGLEENLDGDGDRVMCVSDEGNQALQQFLMSCNPKQQHSTALESYLIKPIQRILKYPLLLTQLKVSSIQYCQAIDTQYTNSSHSHRRVFT